MCKNKCSYGVIDGVQVHINGDVSDPKTMEAIRKMVNLAKNYVGMSRLLKMATPRELRTLGYDDPYRQ